MAETTDHCTACHETFPETETIIHPDGEDECPRCHRIGMTIAVGDAGVCPGCDWDQQLGHNCFSECFEQICKPGNIGTPYAYCGKCDHYFEAERRG